MYYLYKVFLNGTPKYYVGITVDPRIREMAHISTINSSIKDLQDGVAVKGEAYHLVMARHIIATEKRKYRRDSRLHISFKVISEVGETLEEAVAAENRYLSRRGRHCLNRIGKSCYKGGKVDYSARYKYVLDKISKGLL